MRRISVAFLLLIALASLCACVPTGDIGASKPTSVTVVMSPPVVSLNPYSQSLSARRVGRAVFSGLTRPGDDLSPVADLAVEVPTKANGGISADGRTVTYRLKDGVKWHDGKPVTGADVVFTIALQRDGTLVDESGVDYSVIETATAPDPRTVQIKLARPDAPLAWRLAPYVVPQHLLGASGDVASDPYWLSPVGSGPYRIESADPGQRVALKPVAAGPALEVVFAGDDPEASARFAESGVAVLLGTDLASLGAERAVESTLAAQWRRFFFNADPALATSDPALRRGLRHLLLPAMKSSDATRAPYGFRPRRSLPSTSTASAALASARRSSKPLRVDVAAPTPAIGRRFDALLRNWERVGVPNTLVPGADEFYGSYEDAGSLWTGEWDVAWAELPVASPAGWAWPWGVSTIPSAQHPYAPGFQRVTDPVLTRLGEQAREAGTPAEAAAAYKAALERADALDLTIWDEPRPSRALVRAVRGVSLNPMPTEALADAVRWRIEDSK